MSQKHNDPPPAYPQPSYYQGPPPQHQQAYPGGPGGGASAGYYQQQPQMGYGGPPPPHQQHGGPPPQGFYQQGPYAQQGPHPGYYPAHQQERKRGPVCLSLCFYLFMSLAVWLGKAAKGEWFANAAETKQGFFEACLAGMACCCCLDILF
jgi:hypothetical protein